MSIFDKKGSISRRELRAILKRAALPNPRYTRREGVAMEKEIFGSKYGGQISEKDRRIALEKLRKEKFGKSLAERKKIEREISFLKKL